MSAWHPRATKISSLVLLFCFITLLSIFLYLMWASEKWASEKWPRATKLLVLPVLISEWMLTRYVIEIIKNPTNNQKHCQFIFWWKIHQIKTRIHEFWVLKVRRLTYNSYSLVKSFMMLDRWFFQPTGNFKTLHNLVMIQRCSS